MTIVGHTRDHRRADGRWTDTAGRAVIRAESPTTASAAGGEWLGPGETLFGGHGFLSPLSPHPKLPRSPPPARQQ